MNHGTALFGAWAELSRVFSTFVESRKIIADLHKEKCQELNSWGESLNRTTSVFCAQFEAEKDYTPDGEALKAWKRCRAEHEKIVDTCLEKSAQYVAMMRENPFMSGYDYSRLELESINTLLQRASTTLAGQSRINLDDLEVTMQLISKFKNIKVFYIERRAAENMPEQEASIQRVLSIFDECQHLLAEAISMEMSSLNQQIIALQDERKLGNSEKIESVKTSLRKCRVLFRILERRPLAGALPTQGPVTMPVRRAILSCAPAPAPAPAPASKRDREDDLTLTPGACDP